MKQIFIGLIALNLCYLLFQQLSTDEAVVPEELPVSALPAVKPVSPPAVSVASMLPEPVPDSIAQVEVKMASVAAQPAAGIVPDLQGNCVIAGPFTAQREGQALVTQLASAGINATLQPRDTALLPDYMVYVGPENSHAEARALEAKFTARKMDSHVIGAGTLQNALSLGVFSRGPLAKSLRLRLEKEGYDARISELTRNRRGFQVRTRLPQIIRAKLLEADMPMIDCPQAIAQR